MDNFEFLTIFLCFVKKFREEKTRKRVNEFATLTTIFGAFAPYTPVVPKGTSPLNPLKGTSTPNPLKGAFRCLRIY